MPYNFNTASDQKEMLDAIGIETIDQLFDSIPKTLQLDRPLDLPAAMGEIDLTQHMAEMAARNANANSHVCFMGGGSYDHFIPAVVDALASRGEFYTSYTPYQPEVSQGNLQAMFEYQTLICQLTGMDVSNASLYDGGSAVSEAALMCLATTRRNKVVVPSTVHPEYRQILSTYMAHIGVELVVVDLQQGVADLDQLESVVDQQTACVIIQHPNFFGCLEEAERIATLTHENGAMLVMSVDPISLGILKRPGDLGADIVVAEGQSLGSAMAYGGPYLGIMACKEKLVRRMPGRIAGQTLDRRGRRCWVLTLQTREQHIRRDKATSNICTNQGLYALRAAIYLSVMGPRGLRQAAHLSLQKAHYAAERITKDGRFEIAWSHPFFKEFVVRERCNSFRLLQAAKEVRMLNDHARGLLVHDRFQLIQIGDTLLQVDDHQLDTNVGHVGGQNLPIFRVDRTWHHDLVATSRCQAHQSRFGNRTATVVKAGVGDVHPSQLTDESLVFEHRLQIALADFGLIRSVGGVELAPRRQRVDDGWDEVVVASASHKTNMAVGVRIPGRHLSHMLSQIDFAHGSWQVEGAVELQGLGNRIKELVDRFDSDRVQHFLLIGRRVEVIRHVVSVVVFFGRGRSSPLDHINSQPAFHPPSGRVARNERGGQSLLETLIAVLRQRCQPSPR